MPRHQTPRIPKKVVAFKSALDHAVRTIRAVCDIAGSRSHLIEAAKEFQVRKLGPAICNHDTARIFDWLAEMISFQGISDQVAISYMRQHGSVTWRQIESVMSGQPFCPRLLTYWTFDKCGYNKSSCTCREPEHIDHCPLPSHPLRNGRLNQSAYSFYLFIRDIADGDLVGWLDQQIGAVEAAWSPPDAAIERIMGPLRHVFGLSDKVLSMSLATLLIGAGSVRPNWHQVGTRLIVIDTLVHNFMHRTGILARHDADHPYGARCYGKGGCVEILRNVSGRVDARTYSPNYPEYFPRFVQHAIWQFCAQGGLNVCNGNMIDDRRPCQNERCGIGHLCGHVTLKSRKMPTKTEA